VGITERAKPDQAPSAKPATLGDLLFSGRTSPPPPECEWAALLRSIAARDPTALRALFQRTNRLVFTLIMRITGNQQTAEELTLDVFHDVWRRAPEYDAVNGSVIGWVMNQARSRAIDRLRYEQRKKRVSPHPHPQDGEGEGDPTGPHEALAQSERARLVREALATLTPDEREAIEAAFFSGLTHAETATRLRLPLGTVKTRIRSGLGKLRQALEQEPSR
jgi:RNA polymerase sigma-70 factor, ECF subfamily